MLAAAILLLGIFSGRAKAAEELADVYVATTGADTNTGTAEEPVLSLNKALERVANGGTIHIVDSYIAPAGFVWDSHNKDVTITGGTLDLSRGYTEKTEGDATVPCYYQGDGVTYDNLKLILVDGAYYFANGFRLQVNENVTVTGKNIQLFGGGHWQDVAAANVKLLAGDYLKVYGGGYKAKVNGDVNLYVGNINPQYTVSHNGNTSVYGGSLGNGVRGNIYLTVDGANVDWVKGASDSGAAYKDVKVVILGGNFYSVYGGGGGACPIAGNIDLTVAGGTVAQVFGACEGANHQGNVTVKLMGGTITRRFFGGCYNEYSVFNGYASTCHVTGSINVFLYEGMNLKWNSSESDLGFFAHSRYNPLLDDEMTTIHYMNEAAKTKHTSNLGSQNVGMNMAMGSSTVAADTISVMDLTTKVEKWNIAPGEDIGANFYLDVPKVAADMAVVNVTVAGETECIDLSEQEPNEEGLYLISAHVAAAQMTEDITLQLLLGGMECEPVSYTVRAYAETIIEGEYAEEVKALVKHMLNYGAAAQTYFGVNTDKPANAGYELDYTAQIPDSKLILQDFSFRGELFGGDYGPMKLGGVWFVSKEDYVNIQVDKGDILEMTGTEPTDYLTAPIVLQESANVGETSHMVVVSEDPAWGGIASQATLKSAEGITVIGNQKSTVIDSPINEGYFSADGATYPLLEVSCAWKELDTATQDVMFYVELPQESSEMRLLALTCNSWTFWVSPKGMEYQYLSMDSATWKKGTISADDNKTLSLPEGFKGYVRLKINTAENASQFPDTKLVIQNFSFRGEVFGGDYGPMKLGGVWFVSKEDYVKIKVEQGDILDMTNVKTVAAAQTQKSVSSQYLTATVPAWESADVGATSSMAVVEEDPAWAGIVSQATLKSAEGITVIGDQKSTVIDSPINEGYFHADGATYPLFKVNCGWQEIDTATQDLMFYIELPQKSSEIRMWALTCNSWNFWLSPSGMEYQYLSMESEAWESGTVSTDGNKTINLPEGFKGYVRLRLNTAENAEEIPDQNPIQTIKGQINGVRFHGASLLMESKLAIRYYFTADSVDGVSFTVNGVPYTAGEKNGKFYVDVPGIDPHEYSDIMTLSAVRGDERLEVTYSPLNYIVRMREKGSDVMKALVNALYGYHEAAVAYVNMPAKPESWLDDFTADPYSVFDFSEGKDMYGDKTINIIGDSISQGLNSDLFYDNSWASLFKEVIAKKYGTHNIGYVSLLDRTNEAVPGREMHTISFPNGEWDRYYVSGNTPGGMSYATHQQGSILRIEVNRQEGGKDRHINGFYIYYPEGPYRSTFTVQVNGQEVAQIDANRSEENGCARSAYIPLPENCPDDVQIDLIAGDCTDKSVIISGISYIDDPEELIVNNYSLSGIRLVDIDDATLKNMCKANVVILTLGTNDSGTGVDISWFQSKLESVKQACEENGSLLIVGNMIWDRADDPDYAADFKAALRNAAEAVGGYYIDMNTARIRSDEFLETSRPWDVHPTVVGHKLIAQVLCEYLEARNGTEE